MDSLENEIYQEYLNVIAPLISELEVRDGEYPVEIFNEIRSIFTHISRCKLQNKDSELESAHRHVKRAVLDCFKYLCVSIATKMRNFRNSYKKVDLSYADNGRFLPELNRLDSIATEAYKTAKYAEIKNEITESELFELFETAYNKYSELDAFLENSNEAILFASSHAKHSNWINVISVVVTVISIVVAVISFF